MYVGLKRQLKILLDPQYDEHTAVHTTVVSEAAQVHTPRWKSASTLSSTVLS